jgi:hypothetical protein
MEFSLVDPWWRLSESPKDIELFFFFVKEFTGLDEKVTRVF